MKAIKIYLDDEHYELLKGLAEQKELSISALARELILKELGVKRESENKSIEGLNERLNELEKEVKEINEAINKIIKVLKSHKESIEELKECCSQSNVLWAMRKNLKL